jgi:single-strand DNA-binding protein
MNTVTLTGNLTRNAEVRYTTKGIALCTFGIAVSEKQGETEKTNFFDVKCWRSVAEGCAELTKGTPVIIAGSLELEQWDDRQTGQKRSKVVVIASVVGLQLFKRKGEPVKQRTEPFDPQNSGPIPASDDVPF